MTQNSGPWGWHYIADCAHGDLEKIKSPENVQAFVDALVERIDMVKFGGANIERFATHDAEKAGISFCQMIETSNITGHFCENTGHFYIDVFSCKPFEAEEVTRTIQEFFDPKAIGSVVIDRDASSLVGEVMLGA